MSKECSWRSIQKSIYLTRRKTENASITILHSGHIEQLIDAEPLVDEKPLVGDNLAILRNGKTGKTQNEIVESSGF